MSYLNTLNISNFDTSSLEDMGDMFAFSNNLRYVDISGFNTLKVKDMSGLFQLCHKLMSIDLSNFNTSSVTNMENMFCGCHNLKSLDLSNFDTSLVVDMSYMFSELFSLTSLNLNNFNTSSVINMFSMFKDSIALRFLNINSFNTESVTNMKNMFYNCTSLISLNIDNFNTSNLTSFVGIFSNCESLLSLNLNNFFKTYNRYSYYIPNIFDKSFKKLVYCLDIEQDKKNKVMEKLSDFQYNCTDICFQPERKIIIEELKCVLKCNNIYKYEYNGICYKRCPNGTYNSYEDNSLCILGSIDKPEIEAYGNFFNLCFPPDDNNDYKSKDNITDNIRNSLIEGAFDLLISKYIEKEKKDFSSTFSDISYQITSIYNQNNNQYDKISSIKIGEECLNNLKIKNELSSIDSLIIFKTDIFLPSFQIPIIQYEIYAINEQNKKKIKFRYM